MPRTVAQLESDLELSALRMAIANAINVAGAIAFFAKDTSINGEVSIAIVGELANSLKTYLQSELEI